MDQLDKMNIVNELNQWAEENGLSNDTAVNLRRIQLMADDITRKHKCEEC